MTISKPGKALKKFDLGKKISFSKCYRTTITNTQKAMIMLLCYEGRNGMIKGEKN